MRLFAAGLGTWKQTMLLLACLGLAACASSEPGGLGDACDSHDDCREMMRCNSLGQCITVECTSTDQCPTGKICSVDFRCVGANDDGDGDHDPWTDRPCTSTLECPSGMYCAADGVCRVFGDINFPDGDGQAADGDAPSLPDRDRDGLPDEVEDKNGNGEWDEGSETDLNNPDTDGDGIKDGVEDANHDGIWQLDETDPLNLDTDFDKLGDGEEDANQNGRVDPGETDPRHEDTDSDGVIDGNELSGGYSNGGSSDPNNKDTDGDTLPDGMEDANGNGIFEPELGETDPTLADSDYDGTPDNEESVARICQPEQVTEVSLHESMDGDWTLALLPEIVYTALEMNPAQGEVLAAAAFADTANGLAGFILSRAHEADNAVDQVAADNNRLIDIPSNGVLNHRGRSYMSPDEFDAMTSHYTVGTAERTVGDLRNEVLALLSGRAAAEIGNLPDGPPDTAEEFEVLFETLVRPNRVLVLFTVMTKARYEDAGNAMARIRATDLTDGSALRESTKSTDNSCDPFRATAPAVVDIIWVVDDSGSMDPDQAAVAAAADTFATVMTGAGIDFRVAVTSTDCDNGGLGSHKFTNDMSGFQDDVQDPPCGSDEFGLRSGFAAIQKAMNTSLPENERFRHEASRIMIFLSDEEDQGYEDVQHPGDIFTPPGACYNFGLDPVCLQNWLDFYNNAFSGAEVTCFAIVGDTPDGCGDASSEAGQGAGEPGTAYIEVAYHTGGSFGSICAPDMTPTMEEVLRAAAGTASIYDLAYYPITATLQVMIEGQSITRDPNNGFEYDAVANRLVFYGDSLPTEGDDVVVSYRYFMYDSKPD